MTGPGRPTGLLPSPPPWGVQRGDGLVVGGGEALGRRERAVGCGLGGGLQRLALGGVQLRVGGRGPAGQQLGAGIQRVLDVVMHVDLDAGVAQPRGVGVLPAFDGDGPLAELALDGGEFGIPRLDVGALAACERDLPAVEARVRARHRHTGHLLASMVAHHGGCTDFGAAFDEHLGGHRERFAELDAARTCRAPRSG